MKGKEFVVWGTLFCFVLSIGAVGCGNGFREVKRESRVAAEYFQTPDGQKIDPKIVNEAIQRKDWDTLARYSWIHHPEPVARVASGQELLPVFYENFTNQKGERYLKIGKDPVVTGGWSDKDLPLGWFWISLPGDVFGHVAGGLNKERSKERSYKGLLQRGEVVAVHLVIKNGQPVIDNQKGILVRAAAVKRCANEILNDILIWIPVSVFKTIYENKLMVLTKVIERETLVYMEKNNDWVWWLVGIGLAVGVGAGYLLANRNDGITVNNYNTNNNTNINKPAAAASSSSSTTVVVTQPPPPPPPPPPPCPPGQPAPR